VSQELELDEDYALTDPDMMAEGIELSELGGGIELSSGLHGWGVDDPDAGPTDGIGVDRIAVESDAFGQCFGSPQGLAKKLWGLADMDIDELAAAGTAGTGSGSSDAASVAVIGSDPLRGGISALKKQGSGGLGLGNVGNAGN
jgi:hypothetical protein